MQKWRNDMKVKRQKQIKQNEAVIAKAKNEIKPTIVIVLGVQGCGKGTLSEMYLSEHSTNVNYIGKKNVKYPNETNHPIKFKYIGTGDLLRSQPENSPERKAIDKGKFVPDSVIFNLLNQTITTDTNVWGDGLARSFNQAKQLVQSYGRRFNIVAVHFDMPESLVAKRIAQRNAAGAGRADDANMAAVKKRVDTFNRVTMPAITWMRTKPSVKYVWLPIQDAPVDTNYQKLKSELNRVLAQNYITL